MKLLSELIGLSREITEESGSTNELYAEKLAKKLPSGLKGKAILDAAFEQAVKELGQKRAEYYFHRDEDFPADVATAYLNRAKETVSEAREYYPEKVAKALPAGLSGEKLLDAAYDFVEKDLGLKKARQLFWYDEDFKDDVATAYQHVAK